MKKSVEDYMAMAAEQVEGVAAAEAARLAGEEGFRFVDVRGHSEVLKSGKIKGAIPASRGMLEFLIDPESPYYDKRFSEDEKYIVYCGKGGRSLLAAQRMKEMGYERVRSLNGGFKTWKEAGRPIEALEDD